MKGEFPWRLTNREVWRLMRDGFNANEVAHIAGVSRAVAVGMMIEAERDATQSVKREVLRLSAA